MQDTRAKARQLLKEKVAEAKKINEALAQLTDEERALIEMATKDDSYMWWISAERHMYMSKSTAYRKLNDALSKIEDHMRGGKKR